MSKGNLERSSSPAGYGFHYWRANNRIKPRAERFNIQFYDIFCITKERSRKSGMYYQRRIELFEILDNRTFFRSAVK